MDCSCWMWHSDSLTVQSLLLLSVFVARFWLPVVSLGSHSSLVCNPKQSKLLWVFSMASFFGLCLWKNTFWSDLSRSTDANRSTFGCRFQISSFLFHCSFPFFFWETLYRSYTYSSECGYFAQTSWFRQRPGEGLPVLKEQARQGRTTRPSNWRGDSSMRSIDVSWQSEVMTPTGSKQHPTATRDPKESTTRTGPRQRATEERSPKRQTKQALAIASLSGWRSVSRLLATVVTIDNEGVDRGGCRRNLCSLRTPHLCPYLCQRRLFTRAPTLTLRRNTTATEADIWKNQMQAQRNTSREIIWHQKTTRIAIKARFYCVQSAIWWKL